MPVDGRDLLVAAGAQARDHAAHIRHRHELVFAHGEREGRNEDPLRIDAMQIDRFRQTEKGFRPMARRKVAAAGHEIALHREHESVRLEHRRTGEPRGELLAAAIGRHRQCARQLQPVGGAAALQGDADDLPLDAAPGGGKGMGPVGGTQHDEPPYPLRIPLTERERDHPAVGAARDGAHGLDAEMVEKPQEELGLIVGRDAGERLRVPRPGGLAAATQVIEAQDPEPMRVERAVRPADVRPPAGELALAVPVPGAIGLLARLLAETHASAGGNTAEGTHNGSIGRADHAPGEVYPAQVTAMMQSHLARDLEHPLTDDWIGGREHGRANPGRDQDRLCNGVHRWLRKTDPAHRLSCGAPTRNLAGSSRPSPSRPSGGTARLRRPLIYRPAARAARIAGVGTFPGWLVLAVAPASKGLIPQPVSMSERQFRVRVRNTSSEGPEIQLTIACGSGQVDWPVAGFRANVLARYYIETP